MKKMSGLSDFQQSILMMFSAAMISIGTMAAAIPSFVASQWQAPIATALWLVGIIGFGVKEALGSKTPATTK